MRNFYKIIALSFFVIFCFSCEKKETNEINPTIHIIGDSTVKNGKGNGDGGLWGWGDFLSQYIDTTKVKVKNHALGGTSSRTYVTKGLWEPVKDSLKKGDYLFIQFGHNDAGPINDDFRARGTIKGIGDETEEIDNMLTGKHEIVHTYGWYLKQFISQAKEKGVIPVLISPIPRNDWENEKVLRNDTSYGLWTKQVAKKEAVLFINLNDKMASSMEKIGEKNILGSYFHKHDHTHTTARGAVLSASLIIEEVKKNQILTNFILNNPKITYPPKKNVYIIGDSTVANGNDSIVGWGLPIEKFFDTTRVNIINKARGGRSSRTFYNEGLWADVKKKLNPNDFLLIQFGHNDGGNIDQPKYRGSIKGTGDETQEITKADGSKETVHTYGWYLTTYISEAKQKEVIPIILSQIPRNDWQNGKVDRVDNTYGKWAKEIAIKTGAYYIDFNDSIAAKYEKMGADAVKPFFPIDHTHTNLEGANLNALTLAECLKKLKKSGINKYILPQDD